MFLSVRQTNFSVGVSETEEKKIFLYICEDIHVDLRRATNLGGNLVKEEGGCLLGCHTM
jgi:predicted enzyme related to lactoylglutathione lyase